jgi:hypothetical protein
MPRIPAKQVAEEHGFDSVSEMLNEIGTDSVVPACCSEGCEVEPDGCCEHGHPSVLIALGMV